MLGQWFSWGASLLTYLLLTSSPLLSFPLYSHMRGTLGAQPTFFQFLPGRLGLTFLKYLYAPLSVNALPSADMPDCLEKEGA